MSLWTSTGRPKSPTWTSGEGWGLVFCFAQNCNATAGWRPVYPTWTWGEAVGVLLSSKLVHYRGLSAAS